MKSIVLVVLFISSFTQAYDVREIQKRNPSLSKRFQVFKELSLKNKVTIAVIGDYIHTQEFEHLIDVNVGEIDGNFQDDDRNGYLDDRFGMNIHTGQGRLYTPILSGHENGIVSLLDAYITGANISAVIKLLPINITSNERRFDDQYIKKLADAIDYARLRGAQVISMSLGVSRDSNSFFEFVERNPQKSRAYYLAALQRAQNAGIILVSATSNDPGRDLVAEPMTPANSPGVISVANVNFQAQVQSAYGRNVSLAFYGTDLLVWEGQKDGYRTLKGASYSAPLVALILAVGRSLQPSLGFKHLDLMQKSCERPITSAKNVASRCVFSPKEFIRRVQAL